MKFKATSFLAFVPGLLLVACMDTSALDESQSSAVQSITASSEAQTKLYLDDVADSAVCDSNSDKTDASVKEDTKANRLALMSQKVLDRLDADDSGSLSEAEFLGMAKPLDADKAAKQSADDLAAKEEKLKEQFLKFASDDSLLSVAELELALKGQGQRVGKFRHEKHEGEHSKRVKEVTAEVLKKFDTNGDGKLDEAEMKALREADKGERKDKKGVVSAEDLAKFDADADGKLDETEMKALREAKKAEHKAEKEAKDKNKEAETVTPG